jgi:hypothetical protein
MKTPHVGLCDNLFGAVEAHRLGGGPKPAEFLKDARDLYRRRWHARRCVEYANPTERLRRAIVIHKSKISVAAIKIHNVAIIPIAASTGKSAALLVRAGGTIKVALTWIEWRRSRHNGRRSRSLCVATVERQRVICGSRGIALTNAICDSGGVGTSES